VKINRRWVLAGAAACVLGAATGVWMLLHPAAFWLKPWRPEVQHFDQRIIFGPYPIEPDFKALQLKGVTTIVSLLDSQLPYEKILLDQERALAAKYGMQVLNFPMASILGQSFGRDYVANSQAAAQAIRESTGVVYLHCYLGLHRAENVRKLLALDATSRYAGTLKPERSADTLALDRASLAFREGRPLDTLRELATIAAPTPEATLLGAWAYYRLGDIGAARTRFAQVLEQRPELVDAMNGLGFAALRQNDLVEAETRFQRALALKPADLGATEGLGYVRYRQGRGDEARPLLEKVLEQRPDNAEVRHILDRLKQP
jgi:tetratricopeptide (TPR) repeat protein